MRRGFQENLGGGIALSCLLGLAWTCQASLIPEGTNLLFATGSYGLKFKNGVHVIAPDHVYSTATGRVAISNDQMLRAFDPARWFMSFGQGLDSLTEFRDPGTGAVSTFFSAGRTFYSRAMGTNIQEGTLLNRNGTIVATNQELTASFAPGSSASFGLDSVGVINPGPDQEIWFSTKKGFHSQALGRDISDGDLLSTTGQIIATNADLLSAFAPAKPNANYGLDGIQVISSAAGATPEIWFSTTRRFYSNALGRWITPADLLNNSGQIVATNKELFQNFGRTWLINPGLKAFTIDLESGAQAGLDIGRVLPPSGGQDAPPPGQTTPPAVPDPATLALLAIGSVIAAGRRWA